MDIGKSFTYVFDDEKWITKVLVGGLFILASGFLVGIPFLVGYMLQTMRNVRQGVEKPLPEWDNLGEKFREGLILALVYIVWAIPIWILAVIAVIAGALSGSGSDAAVAVGSTLSICISCLIGLWGIVIAVLTPALFIRFAEKPEFKTGFEFAELWQITRENIGNIIIAVLLYWVADFISGFGLILCGVGVLFTAFWAYMVGAHLFGQVWLNRKGTAGEPPAVEQPVVS